MTRRFYLALGGTTVLVLLLEFIAVRRNEQQSCTWSGDCPVDHEEYRRGDSSNTIIFLETSGKGRLTGRTSCAVESAAKHHPQRTVLLFFHGEDIPKNNPFLRLLEEVPNVHVRKGDLKAAFADTPLEPWFASGSLSRSRFQIVHLSDALRLALTYKLGGVYMDTDVVVLKSLLKLRNCVSRSLQDMVANGFLIFDRGHPFLLRCMEELAKKYRPNKWGANGPVLLRRVLLELCNASHVEDIEGRSCGGVTVLPTRFLLPLNYTMWRRFFDPRRTADVWRTLRESYVMHVFGKMSKETKVKENQGSAYEQAAKLHCPNSFRTAVTHYGHF